MRHLIRGTDVKVTSVCNKGRRNKIKLAGEASLSEPKAGVGGGGGDYLKKEGGK